MSELRTKKKLPNTWAYHEKLRVALQNTWSRETAYHADALRWSPQCPSIGQCAVTSLIIQDYFGGTIKFSRKYNHYWNFVNSKDLDLTADQFGDKLVLNDAVEIERNSILEKARFSEARTPERYNLLLSRVTSEMEKLSPILFLFSSNARKEYIIDILECLSLPNGFSHHFRYQQKHVAEELLSILPKEDDKLPVLLKTALVVPVYLQQSHIVKAEPYKWLDAVPIRAATLLSAYRTGEVNDPLAISHFHFLLRGHLEQKSEFYQKLKSILGKQIGSAYAAFGWGDKRSLFTEHDRDIPFEQIIETFNPDKFTYNTYNGPKEHKNPLYLQIFGIFSSRGKEIAPKYDEVGRNSFYQLGEGKQYLLKFRSYTRGIFDPFRISLSMPKEQFANPEKYKLCTDSSYDSEAWALIPRYCNQHTRTNLLFQTKNEKKPETDVPDQRENLDLDLKIPIEIRRGKIIRLIDIAGEVGLGVGTAYLALSKLYENNRPAFMPEWYAIVLPAFIIWIVAKIIIKYKRG